MSVHGINRSHAVVIYTHTDREHLHDEVHSSDREIMYSVYSRCDHMSTVPVHLYGISTSYVHWSTSSTILGKSEEIFGLSDEYFDTSDGQASSSDGSLHVCSNG